jgi:hypothetical protein
MSDGERAAFGLVGSGALSSIRSAGSQSHIHYVQLLKRRNIIRHFGDLGIQDDDIRYDPTVPKHQVDKLETHPGLGERHQLFNEGFFQSDTHGL